VIVVGYMRGKPQIVIINDTGGSQFVLPIRKYDFLGGGQNVAWVVSETMRADGVREESETTLRTVMDRTIKFALAGRG
jgi:hypothetical protein